MKKENSEEQIAKTGIEYSTLIKQFKPKFGDADVVRISNLIGAVMHLERMANRKGRAEDSRKRLLIEIHIMKKRVVIFLKHFINKSN